MNRILDTKTRILAILCIAQFGSMLVWYNFAAVLPVLREQWQLNNDQAGTLLSVFQLGYVAAVLFAGCLTDKIGGRLTFSLCAIETGLAGIGFALFASDYHTAIVWRLLAGIGQGGLYIPGMQILSRWYPVKQRGMALGVYTCSLVASYAAAYLVTAPLAAIFSWQTAIFWTSIWAIPSALLVFLFIPGKSETLSAQPDHVAESSVKPIKPIWKKRAVWFIILGYTGHMWELYAFNGWIGSFSTYTLQRHGFGDEPSLAYGGAIASACLLMGAVSPALVGWLSDRRGRCLTASVVLLLSGAGSLLFGWLSAASLWVFVPTGLLYSFFIVADSAIFKAGLTELVPPAQLGASLSLQSVVGFGITIISPKLFGMVLDSFGWGWAFSLLGIGPIVGILAMLRLRSFPESEAMAGGQR
jgi:MFS family permease